VPLPRPRPRGRTARADDPAPPRPHRDDFFWPDLGFVVETDSLRHHRTAAEQATDIGRDQAHVRAGLKDTFDHLVGASTGAGAPIA
jgi:hypothetical protein